MVCRDDPAIAKYWEAAQQCFDTRFGWAASVAGIQALVSLLPICGDHTDR
jgi:hypothetical protein